MTKLLKLKKFCLSIRFYFEINSSSCDQRRGLKVSNTFLGKIIINESRRKGFIRPVLKHGPRSPAYTRVPGWKTLARSESKATLRIVYVSSIDLSDMET